MSDDNSANENIIIEDTLPVEGVENIYTVESAIKLRSKKLSELKEKQKKVSEMLKSYLENDAEYVEAAKIAKDAAAKKNGIKKRLLSLPEAQGLAEKIEEIRDEKRELQESLSYYLSEFSRLSGTNEIEDENGELKQIVYMARLVKRSGGK